MDKRYRHDMAHTSIWTTDRKRPLDFSFKEFESWLKSEWNVVQWQYSDWKETPNPRYTFVIHWGEDIGWDIGEIEGFIPEHKNEIIWVDRCSAGFVLDFVRKFVVRFPDNGDHLCFHDGEGGFSLYRPDLTDEELYDRIVGKRHTHDEELQRRIIASYSQGQDP